MKPLDSFDGFDEDAYLEELAEMERIVLENAMSEQDDGDGDNPSDSKPSVADVVNALGDYAADAPPDPAFVYGLSNIGQTELKPIADAWVNVIPATRRAIVRHLVEASENQFQLDYRTFGLYLLTDDDPRVREVAVELLWEDYTLEVMNVLVDLAQHDSVVGVRAAAMSALGRYVLAGELEDLPEDLVEPARKTALTAWEDRSNDVHVRRRALEALSNMTAPVVNEAIAEAYESPYHEMRVSAVFAMGRSCDSRWEDHILEEIEGSDAEMQYEAARAAGELQLQEAVPRLAHLLLEGDREIVDAAVWSLGEIGGKAAMRVLEALADKADEEGDFDLLQAVEDAIGNASLGEGFDFAL